MSADKCLECEALGITEAPAYDDSQHDAKDECPKCGAWRQASYYAECPNCGEPVGERTPAPLTFTLTITLGNDGMLLNEDIAEALHRTAHDVEQHEGPGTIRDLNGNTVGSWAVK